MPSSIHFHRFDNGLVLLVEEMDWLESAAFSVLMPAGCVRDPMTRLGLSNFTCELVQRGCGERDSRQFVTDLENLGVDSSSSASVTHTSFGGAMPADKLSAVLPIYADLVQRPQLPAAQMEDARHVCLQELRALDDDLPQQVMKQLRLIRYGKLWGRHSLGTRAALEQLTRADVSDFFTSFYRPNGAILSVAGKVEFERVRDQIAELFGEWQTADRAPLPASESGVAHRHIAHPSEQMHLGIAYASVPYGTPDYYHARAAVGVLSDGMSSRLFTEVREKRGLCYTVYAVCHTLHDRGSVFCYAGTTTQRAQETLDVILQQLKELRHGVRPDELERLKAQLKSTLIMQQESSASRASAMAADWFYLQRVQTIDEVRHIVDDLTCASINAYLDEHPPQDFAIVTLGQSELEPPCGVS